MDLRVYSLRTGGQLQAAQSFAASFQRPGFFTERPSRPEEKPRLGSEPIRIITLRIQGLL